MKKILVTGGAGFIGSNFIRYMLNNHPEYEIICLDKLTYSGNRENLKDCEENPNFSFIQGDISDEKLLDRIDCDAILNFAAATHVDRSIEPQSSHSPFIDTNVRGVLVLLEFAKRRNVERMVQVSTDEIYGPIESGVATEEAPLRPSSLYSASKAAGDLVTLSYYRTHNLPVIITRTTNNFGRLQYPEKIIPLFITNAIEDKPVPLYGDGLYKREWIYVEDNCEVIDVVLHRGKIGEIYNIGSGVEVENLELTKMILKKMGKPESLIKHVKDRPGHDRRYALDSTKVRKLGWQPRHSFDAALDKTIAWYKENVDWWKKVKEKQASYAAFYKRQYGERL